MDSDGDGSDEMWVHAGFLQAYESVRVDILPIVNALLDGEKQTWTIYCTGHSLGGALEGLSVGGNTVSGMVLLLLFGNHCTSKREAAFWSSAEVKFPTTECSTLVGL